MHAHPAGPRHGDVVANRTPPPLPVGDASALDPSVWPLTAERSTDGSLLVGRCDVRDLARDFQTPLYVLDEVDFRQRAADFRRSYAESGSPATVYYAAKAFLATAVAQWVEEEGLGLDVSTGGELAVALAAGFPGERIILHGNNKSVSEIERALDAKVAVIVIDSLIEIDRVADAAAARSIVADVLLRVTVGVEAHTHEFIATAHEDQKFGLPVDEVTDAVRRIRQHSSLRFAGLHSHIGSQIFDASGFEIAATRIVDLAAALTEDGIPVEQLDLGGGMGIAYVPADDPIDAGDMAAAIDRIVVKSCDRAGIPVPRLSFEPGRAIVGPAGITIYEVGTVKPVVLDHGLVRTFVSVDGGMSDNIRTALYDADYTVVLASRDSSAELMLSRVVGKHCESGDIVVRDAWLPGDLRPGDLLAVAATGAYCRSMASQYNYVPRPAVVSVREGSARIVLRRESEEDLLALDPGAVARGGV
jgi:diaminopimelate decarboxylase